MNLSKVGKIKKLLRKSRKASFYIVDFFGDMLFTLSGFLGLIPKKSDFSKEKIKKILIIRIDRIGDLILSTPAIRAVKESFPDAEISLLIREYTKDLVIQNSNISRLLIHNADKIDSDYDLAVVLHPGFRENYLTFASGARYRAGYTGWGGGFFLTHKLPDDRETRIRHEVESALEVVRTVGCETGDRRPEVSVTSDGENFAEEYFKKNGLSNSVVIIHPGARQEYIRWRKEGFAEVADLLIKEKKVKVIFSGSTVEKRLIEEILSLMKEKPLVAEGLELTQLVSLIKRCDLFIGNSTGPMHIAAALGVPVAAIFGNIHPLDSYQDWGPWGEGHIVITKDLNCSNCHPGDCKNFDCMKMISTADVISAVNRKLKKEL